MRVSYVPGPVLIILHDLFKAHNNVMKQVLFNLCPHSKEEIVAYREAK